MAETSATVEIDKRHLFTLWIETHGNFKIKMRNVYLSVSKAHDIDLNQIPKHMASKIEKHVKYLCSYFNKLWNRHGRSKQYILTRYSNFFEKPFTLPVEEFSCLRMGTVGRKSLTFEECSNVTKRKKTADIRNLYRSNELAFATQMKFREEKKTDAAEIIKEVSQTTPSRATKIRDSWRKSETNPVYCYTDMEALALMVESDLSVSQYNLIQSGAKIRNADIYPPYYKVLAAKKNCYPADEFVVVSETDIEIKLQQLLDLTAERIVEVNEGKLINFSDAELMEIEMTVKYGMDGSTGNSEYHQVFENDDGSKSDASIFMSALVPIKAASKKNVLFQNPRPSSTRLCRPIHIQMAAETVELVTREKDHLARQIESLEPTELTRNGRKIRITYKMLLTMVDGKVCSALTGTKSAARCYICQAKPTEMNDIDNVRKLHIDESSFQFGLSTLHAWIRFLEYFLKVSYRIEVKKWAPRGEPKKEMLKRKIMIQKRFKVEMGLHADQPRAGGSGSSNTGNVARRFFENAEVVAKITGLNLCAIQRCGTILQVMASGHEVNTTAFGDYCEATARLLVRLYPWYYLPASIHKILVHGSAVMENFLVPIGQLSEEAQEAKNKEWKRYREHHTRKISRKCANEDLLHWLLVSSDPVVTEARGWPKSRIKSLSEDAKALLVNYETDEEENSE